MQIPKSRRASGLLPCYIAIIGGICLLCISFLQFNIATKLRLFSPDTLNGVHLAGKVLPGKNVMEIVFDDDSISQLQKHFRMLGPDRQPVAFLPAQKTNDDVSSHNTTMTIMAPDEFRQALERGFNVFQNSSEKIKTALSYSYVADEKQLPYVGSHECETKFGKEGAVSFVKYLNCFAVFPSAPDVGLPSQPSGMHGLIGFDKFARRMWTPSPMPPLKGSSNVNMTEQLKIGGGFYLALSDALPLDRETKESRDALCLAEKYDLSKMEDASVIVVFYNEPMSTLLRSIHSVLNRTPPELLREILLVDDHSNATHLLPGGELEKYITTLPKVKLLRLPVRRGIVPARLAGAKMALAPVLVILDSHVEVNNGWLEPQLQRLAESPRSVVAPQIDAIDSSFFNYTNVSGIGCWLGFRWTMQEQASMTPPRTDTHVIPSPSMAGGLFAVRAEWFWEIGGYDEGFEMWGAENVEMGFRVWMCGGRVECTPCARVYHIYRQGGVGYSSPSFAIQKNRLRTARVWTDEHFQVAREFIHAEEEYMGNIDHMLELKEKLHCKNFQWYLDHVDPENELRDLDSIQFMSEIRSVADPNYCVDTLSHDKAEELYGHFSCHGMKGSQGFMLTSSGRIVTFSNDRRCLSAIRGLTLQECEYVVETGVFVMQNTVEDKDSFGGRISQITWVPSSKVGDKIIRSEDRTKYLCLTLKMDDANPMSYKPCLDPNASEYKSQIWKTRQIDRSSYKPPAFSDEYVQRQRRGLIINEKSVNETVWKYGKTPDGVVVDQLVMADAA